MSITIKDVAKKAGVSVSTTSRVLRNEGYFSKEAEKKVLKAAEDLNYRLNAIGKSLRSKKSTVIGHISRGGSLVPFSSEIIKGIDKRAHQSGYNVMVCNTNGDNELEKELINTLLERRVDGIIINNPVSRENIEYLKKQNTPFVMIEEPIAVNDVDKVVVDNKKIVYKAVSYLFDKGHRDIVFIGKKPIDLVSKNRLKGYKKAFANRGFKLNEDNIVLKDEYTFENGKKMIKEYFDKKNKATAMIIAGDILILGAMQQLYKLGINIPDDISIIGLNNLLTPFLAPALTSIAQPVFEMGMKSVELLLDRLNNPEMEAVKITLETVININDSVKVINN